MRTIAREAAFQIALKYRSKEAGGDVSTYVILVQEEVRAIKDTSSRRLLLVS